MKKKNYRRKQKRTQKLEQKINGIIYAPSYLEMLLKVTNSSILAQKGLQHLLETGRSWQKELLGHPFFIRKNIEVIESSPYRRSPLEIQLLYFFPHTETDVTPRPNRINFISIP